MMGSGLARPGVEILASNEQAGPPPTRLSIERDRHCDRSPTESNPDRQQYPGPAAINGFDVGPLDLSGGAGDLRCAEMAAPAPQAMTRQGLARGGLAPGPRKKPLRPEEQTGGEQTPGAAAVTPANQAPQCRSIHVREILPKIFGTSLDVHP